MVNIVKWCIYVLDLVIWKLFVFCEGVVLVKWWVEKLDCRLVEGKLVIVGNG